MRPPFIYAIVFVVTAMTTSMAHSADWDGKGHLKYQFSQQLFRVDDLAASNGGRAQNYHRANFRYIMSKRDDEWSYDVHYSLTYQRAGDSNFDDGSSGVDYPPKLDKTKLFNLSRWMFTDTQNTAEQRLDRLLIGYAAQTWSLSFGRQAVSWGNGLNFHPLDIFNPFSPDAVDKEYKNGDDLLYGQWLLGDGADVQMILVPRRDATSEDLSQARSSLAVKYRDKWTIGDVEWLLARHYDESVVGLGWSHSLGEAMVRADVAVSNSNTPGVSGIINSDYSWTWYRFNFYGYVEYYYQSVGVKHAYDTLPYRLTDRMARSETFVMGEHYVTSGVMLELTPLLRFSPAVIMNAVDRSFLFPVHFNYEWKQDWSVILGSTLSYGRRDTEFGGVAIPQTTYYSGRGQLAYVLVAHYF